jgi:U4/U6 small nuclear ribonucleoprotein PRP31
MSTLADELLQDFEDSGSEGEETLESGGLFPDNEDSKSGLNGHATNGGMELDGDEEEVDEDEEMAGMKDVAKDVEDEEETKAKIEKMQLGGVDDVRSVAGLMRTLEPVLEVSYSFIPHFTSLRDLWFTSLSSCTSPDNLPTSQKIAHFQSLPPEKQTAFVGSIEDNPEYHLLTQSNTLSTSIDSEIILVHKFIRDHYSIRFPELETLVGNPLDYAKVVTIIGNGPMDGESMKKLENSKENRLGSSLRSVLDGPSVMIVTVEATTTKGREMTPSELERVMRACDMTLALDRAKKTLTDYVQSRMNLFAPNLTALIGSLTAAQLLNFAGGLTGLAKTPACNLPPLGSKKQSGTGFATNVGVRQQGFLYHSPIIKGIPNDLKRQAMRIVSAKVEYTAAQMDQTEKSSRQHA